MSSHTIITIDRCEIKTGNKIKIMSDIIQLYYSLMREQNWQQNKNHARHHTIILLIDVSSKLIAK